MTTTHYYVFIGCKHLKHFRDEQNAMDYAIKILSMTNKEIEVLTTSFAMNKHGYYVETYYNIRTEESRRVYFKKNPYKYGYTIRK